MTNFWKNQKKLLLEFFTLTQEEEALSKAVCQFAKPRERREQAASGLVLDLDLDIQEDQTRYEPDEGLDLDMMTQMKASMFSDCLQNRETGERESKQLPKQSSASP